MTRALTLRARCAQRRGARASLLLGLIVAASLLAFAGWLAFNTYELVTTPKAFCSTDAECEAMFDQAGPAGPGRPT